MNKQHPFKDWQLISEYLDGQLSAQDKARVEARFAKEPDLYQVYLEFRQTKFLLKQAKPLKAPRNFTITETQAQTIKPTSKNRFLPLFSVSSVLAILLMVFAFFFEQPLSSALMGRNSAPLAAQTFALEAAPMDTVREEAPLEEPMIIQWGTSAYGMGSGGGDSSALLSSGIEGDPSAKVYNEYPQEPGLAPSPEAATSAAEATLEAKPITGAGPILGVRSEQEADEFNQAAINNLNEEASAQTAIEDSSLSLIRWIQLGLALIALITGGIAITMWRRSKI
jgi:anti-sigma-K factor RskA